MRHPAERGTSSARMGTILFKQKSGRSCLPRSRGEFPNTGTIVGTARLSSTAIKRAIRRNASKNSWRCSTLPNAHDRRRSIQFAPQAQSCQSPHLKPPLQLDDEGPYPRVRAARLGRLVKAGKPREPPGLKGQARRTLRVSKARRESLLPGRVVRGSPDPAPQEMPDQTKLPR